MNRNQFSIDGSGRRFSQSGLTNWREQLCQQLEKTGKEPKIKTAQSYRKMSLVEFANQGGYTIVKRRSKS